MEFSRSVGVGGCEELFPLCLNGGEVGQVLGPWSPLSGLSASHQSLGDHCLIVRRFCVFDYALLQLLQLLNFGCLRIGDHIFLMKVSLGDHDLVESKSLRCKQSRYFSRLNLRACNHTLGIALRLNFLNYRFLGGKGGLQVREVSSQLLKAFVFVLVLNFGNLDRFLRKLEDVLEAQVASVDQRA